MHIVHHVRYVYVKCKLCNKQYLLNASLTAYILHKKYNKQYPLNLRMNHKPHNFQISKEGGKALSRGPIPYLTYPKIFQKYLFKEFFVWPLILIIKCICNAYFRFC